MNQKPKSVLFSAVIYSVLVVLILLIVSLGFILFSFDTMTELYTFFFGTSFETFGEIGLSLSLAFLLVAIYAVFQILRKKIHGMYLFFVLSVLLIVFIVQVHPIDLLSIFMVFVVNFVLYINRRWFHEIEIDADQESIEDQE